jgi:3-hydroxyisobutyrate dehydrogenase-like beta-hydroxyacid dehydrogenase
MAERIAVLGLGNMGSALANALLSHNNEVTVWNRTESKAEPLVASGASLAASPVIAVAECETIIVCVGNYDDSNQIFSDFGDLSGKTMIQLTTGTAVEAEAMRGWVESKGGVYLDGVIVAYPSGIGHDETLLLVAGSEIAWTESENIVKSLGGASMYLGGNLAAPIALEAAMVGPALMAIMGMIQGAHLLEQAGLDVGFYAEMLPATAPILIESLCRQANAIATNDFSDTEASLGTYAAALNHSGGAFGHHAGIDLVGPIRELLNRAVNAGYGDEEIAAVIKVLRQSE